MNTFTQVLSLYRYCAHYSLCGMCGLCGLCGLYRIYLV